MNVLSIGNSFSQDAQKYLHEIAASGGMQLHAENLYIGGCPLQIYAEDLRSGEAAYDDEINGKRVGTISLPEALRLRAWDVITLQRSSGMSGEYDSYQPYLNELAAAVGRPVRGRGCSSIKHGHTMTGRIIRTLPATAATASRCSRS